jgi:tetratricopeptide (TPR) repeat protein
MEFLEQRDKGVMVVQSEHEQIGYAIQILKSIEDGGSPDVFLPFAHEFSSPCGFASFVAERVKASELAARKQVGERSAALPPMPALATDESCEAHARVRATLEYVRSILQPNTGQRLVCAFLPMVISDAAGYGRLMRKLIEPEGMPPWYHRMRIIVRDETDSSLLQTDVARAPFVAVHRLDFSPETIAASLEQTANDPNASREERARSLLQLAYLDYAQGRDQQALEKFTGVFTYYEGTKNAVMQAIALTGIGSVHQRSGDFARAWEWYCRAIRPAGQSKSPMVLFTLARDLGQVAFGLQRYQDAESYFHSAQLLGLQVYDPESKIAALEWKSVAQIELSAHDRARESLKEALATAREFGKQDAEQRIQVKLNELNGSSATEVSIYVGK